MGRTAFLLFWVSILSKADDRLTAIHDLLVPLRTAPIGDARGATPALTTVKHELRDWIENRIAVVRWTGNSWSPNLNLLQEEINGELGRADLLCPQNQKCWENPLGHLNPVVLESQFSFLIVRTTVGVQICGSDDSAYIYEFTNDRWRRVWESEQSNYTEERYFPQRLVDVKISPKAWDPKADHGEHLIATTGVLPWCTSVWQPVYYRVWQTKSNSESRLIVDGSEMANIDGPIYTRVNQEDVFIQYEIIADDGERIPELRHFVVENGKLRRTDPVALTPQNFVSFWLRHPWDEVSDWTDTTTRVTLKPWRERYKGTNSEFESPTRHCTNHPDLWQVETNRAGEPDHKIHYFLLRARPPFRFTMVAASDRPWADCTQPDPAIDNPPSIFEK